MPRAPKVVRVGASMGKAWAGSVGSPCSRAGRFFCRWSKEGKRPAHRVAKKKVSEGGEGRVIGEISPTGITTDQTNQPATRNRLTDQAISRARVRATERTTRDSDKPVQRAGVGEIMQGQGEGQRRVQSSRWLSLGSLSRVPAAVRCGLLLTLAVATPAQASAKLVLIPDYPTLVGLILLFLGLIVVTNALIFKPIFQALDERSSRVEGARQRAEEVDRDSDALLQRYELSIHEARSEADAKRKNKLGHAREEQLSMAEVARA
ncbi:MAG TPA: hypothetical protein EYQ66_00685, partial [Myxococcales bacterium]|nr:hypothetical protein [Myxococcales bacterium]